MLYDWQKISRVQAGQPFGSGLDGDYSGVLPTLTNLSLSGVSASAQKNITIASAGFSDGDLVLIHQTRGAGVGHWEINKIVSGGGTTTLVMQENLAYTYTDDGGNSQAQIIKIPQYRTLSQTGTWTIPSWNGNVGGIIFIAVRETGTIVGNVVGNGSQGADSVGSGGGATGGGFWGGDIGRQGEGSAGVRGADSRSANGSGGGGAHSDNSNAGGGGGAGATNGIGGNYQPNGSTAPGAGGVAVTSADLSTFTLGAGGGGGEGTVNSGGGGSGGAVLGLIVKNFTLTGSISLRGGRGGYPYEPAVGGRVNYGGGGGGGNFLLMCQFGTLGTNLVNAASTTTSNGYYSEGGQGGIAVHYSGVVTGSTTPTLTLVSDPTLIETGGSFLLNMT